MSLICVRRRKVGAAINNAAEGKLPFNDRWTVLKTEKENCYG